MSGLWWLPSLIVFGVTAVIVVGAVRLLRARRGTAGRINNVVRSRAGVSAAQPLSSGAPISQDIAALRRDANVALVRLDDAIDAATDELGFAAAQFGDAETTGFAQTLIDARQSLAEAFTLAQKLDDAWPDTEREQRDWTRHILLLASAAAERIAGWDDAFGARRRSESNAPSSLESVRAGIQAARSRLPETAEILGRMLAAYSPRIVAPVAANPDAARTMLERADASATAAAAGLAAAPPLSVTAQLLEAEGAVRAATHALDAVAALERGLIEQIAARALLMQDLDDDLAPAKAVRDTPPDADHGAAVGTAVAEAESALALVRGRSIPGAGGQVANPLADIGELREASERLDTALAGARNQTERLRHARTAFVGAVVIAQSQIDVARTVIMGGRAGRGSVGAGARTRLAEAERVLELAKLESDPVAALDSARRANTLATDAEALARYDLL